MPKITPPDSLPVEKIYYLDGEPHIVYVEAGHTFTFIKERGSLEITCTGVRRVDDGALVKVEIPDEMWQKAREALKDAEIDPET